MAHKLSEVREAAVSKYSDCEEEERQSSKMSIEDDTSRSKNSGSSSKVGSDDEASTWKSKNTRSVEDEKWHIATLYTQLFRVFITDMKPFYEENVHKFSGDVSQENDHSWPSLYDEYKTIIDKNFSNFAIEHGYEDVSEFFERISDITLDDRKSSKQIKRILRITSYKGFVRHMHMKARELNGK